MADDQGPLDQNEIEKLLGGGGGSAEEPASGAEAGPIGQDEIEALLGGGGPSTPPPAASTPPAPEETEDADKLLSQGEIEALLGGGAGGGTGGTGGPAPGAPAAKGPAPAQAAAATNAGQPAQAPNGEEFMASDDMDYLLNQAEEALQSVVTDHGELPGSVLEFQLPEFGGAMPTAESATLDLLSGVELDVKIELGRTNLFLEDVLKLRRGSVVPLDKLAGDPVDIFVNGRLVARGEVLVLNDNFCVRVAELVASASPAD